MSSITRILDEYDPEYDVIQGGPNVTWAEAVLATEVKALWEEVEKLRDAGQGSINQTPQPAPVQLNQTTYCRSCNQKLGVFLFHERQAFYCWCDDCEVGDIWGMGDDS